MTADLPPYTYVADFIAASESFTTKRNSSSKNISRGINLHKIDSDIVELIFTKEVITQYIRKDFVVSLPQNLAFLKTTFKNSEYILSLEEDWDENNSPSYNIETWKTAVNFVSIYATSIFDNFNKIIENPKIFHGPNSSIDILFENDKSSFLINIIENSKFALYFGKDKVGNISKGQIKIGEVNYSLLPILYNI